VTKELDVAAAHDAFVGGAFLLDVREPNEWRAGHDPGAVHVPMGDVAPDHDAIPKDQTILVICKMGGRSAAVTDALTGWGYDAINVAGGMTAWAVEYPPVDDTGAPGYIA
jgi:rhodanese-related sulfurtransferase